MTVFKQSFLAGVIAEYIFAPAMKKTAAILLFIFTLVQVVPAVNSLFSASAAILVMDEEKGNEKTDTEKKDNKNFTSVTTHYEEVSYCTNTAFHLAEKIHSFPCLEKPTPPPNFC